MIKLPYQGIPYICQDLLGVLLTAVFVDVEDTRLVSLSEPITNEERVESLRESPALDDLLKLLDIFGEDDFIVMIKPNLIKFTEDVSLRKGFMQSFENNFKEIK